MTSTAGDGDKPGADKGGAYGAKPSPDTAVDDMRTTAKWTLAVVGAVGAALISGGPLIAVGQVHDLLHGFLAGLGLVIALAGIGVAIWFTSQVLTPRLTTPAELIAAPAQIPRPRGLSGWVSRLFRVNERAELSQLTILVNNQPDYFFGLLATSVADLLLRQKTLLNFCRALPPMINASQDSGQRKALQEKLAAVESDWVRVFACVGWLVSAANARLIQEELRRSRVLTFTAGVLVIIGAVLFFTATSGGPTYVPVLTPQQSVTPAATPSVSATPISSAKH